MTHDEIKQLSAYSRYDGFYLAILWVASFVCLLYMTYVPFLGQVYTILLFSTPSSWLIALKSSVRKVAMG